MHGKRSPPASVLRPAGPGLHLLPGLFSAGPCLCLQNHKHTSPSPPLPIFCIPVKGSPLTQSIPPRLLSCPTIKPSASAIKIYYKPDHPIVLVQTTTVSHLNWPLSGFPQSPLYTVIFQLRPVSSTHQRVQECPDSLKESIPAPVPFILPSSDLPMTPLGGESQRSFPAATHCSTGLFSRGAGERRTSHPLCTALRSGKKPLRNQRNGCYWKSLF